MAVARGTRRRGVSPEPSGRHVTAVTDSTVPRIEDLPPPPKDRTGWPWTDASDPVPPTMRDGTAWPSITIVTPSYQQAGFLEETLRSVLLQGYPKLEYIVVDGGSTDGSVDIIRSYAPWITRWVSESDDGQSDAINKGFRWATGSILGWLNSDDTYHPGALAEVAEAMHRAGTEIVLGAMDKVQFGDGEPRLVKRSLPWEGEPFHPFPILRNGPAPAFHFYQPSMFWTRELWEETGGLDDRYHYVMDMEWCNRALAAGARIATVPDVWTRFALHGGSKSQDLTHLQQAERITMYRRLGREPGFRRLYCLLSTVKPAQVVLSLLAGRAERDGGGLRMHVYRNGARLLKGLRRVVPGLRGAANLEGRAERPSGAA